MKLTQLGLILLVLGGMGVRAEQTIDPGALTPHEFDCIDSFNLFAGFVLLRCALVPPQPRDEILLQAAKQSLVEHQLAQPREFVGVEVGFCPLVSGTGIVTAANRIYLDDGMRGASPEGLAEVFAHELVHVHQLNILGEREFKCRYVEEMSACGNILID